MIPVTVLVDMLEALGHEVRYVWKVGKKIYIVLRNKINGTWTYSFGDGEVVVVDKIPSELGYCEEGGSNGM